MEIRDYSVEWVYELLGNGNRAAPRYLVEYLEHLKPKSMCLEERYDDRHYRDDYCAYYARAFNPPEPTCKRLHWFGLAPGEVEAAIQQAYSGCLDEAQSALNAGYLGFSVVRPLNRALGRTVLKPWGDDSERVYVTRSYDVHVGPIALSINGLAYQEQEGGAAVCASTALWVALQRVADVSGFRTPTPSEVTRVSSSPYQATQGLNVDQLARAVHALGYVAELLIPAPGGHVEAYIAACLKSGIPMVAMTEDEDGGHAVALTGFRRVPLPVDVVIPDRTAEGTACKIIGAGVSTVYAHDDNLGFYCHYELYRDVEPATGYQRLMLRRQYKNPKPEKAWWPGGSTEVGWILIAKPPKHRVELTIFGETLICATEMADSVYPTHERFLEPRFVSGVEYRQELTAQHFDACRLRAFQERVAFPRIVGVVRVTSSVVDSPPLLELIFDLSDAQHEDADVRLLAVVAFQASASSNEGLIAESLTNGDGQVLFGQ